MDEDQIKAAHNESRDSNKVVLKKDQDQNGMYIICELMKEKFHIPPSMKLLATMAVILQWQQEHPEDKIIGMCARTWSNMERSLLLTIQQVFTTFVMTAKIMGRMLRAAKMENFGYYYGSMSQKQKDKAISEFKDNPVKKILVSQTSPMTPNTLTTDLTLSRSWVSSVVPWA